MSPLAKLHKIGAFAKMAATNLRTLRYYEEVGLLRPAARSSGGFRYYRGSDLNRVRLISKLQELGLTLQEIRDALGQERDQGDRIRLFERVNAALGTHSRLLREHSKAISAQQKSINLTLEKLEQCSHCQSIPSRENNYCEPCELDGKPLPELLSGLF
jgi:DNA-binding transcriptional MerR regulator